MKVGKAKYGGGKKSFKIENGNNVYRILPPLGELADAGKWFQYYRIEWGYKNTKGQQKPFQDVRVMRWKNGSAMVEVESAAHLRREALKSKLSDTRDLFKAGNATREQVQDVVDLIKRYNLDAKFYMNAVNLQGEIGLLKLNKSFKTLLMAEIDKQTNKGKDPVGVENGIFFNFHRSNDTGKLQDWVFSVTPDQETIKAEINGNTALVEQIKTHTMDDAFRARLSSEAFELSGMYPELTNKQVEELVKAGDNHAALVDQLFGSGDGKKTNDVAEKAVEKRAETVAETPTTSVAETAPVATSVPVVESTTPVEATPTPVVESTTPTPAASEELSDDDFLDSIGAAR